ncbi:DUF6124 family protein [Pseudomonas sp. TNT2022 ID1044]|uniref:DUF6124 family protein n=1 Tax=Pseudomonas sp. TNT2022 ID1044 TaxID=2942636 RepID=UPI00236075F7|nr:DUF6124 family protein [Pseudomonas sp. TNT2022 ID1044]MDD0996990.1 DUF6124 family protein [Pseudomonas sp. TNT2022 ID1044]
MSKVTSTPPDTDHIPSAADIRATPRTLCTMYVIDPQIDVETLLADACESLASAHVMTLDLADRTEGSSRNILLDTELQESADEL